jgi:hypothetical protein
MAMAKDHYVAQTYLRYFGESAEKGFRLQGYAKPSGKVFPCYPQDVCQEWNGDLNPEFFVDHPGVRGEFRKIFEPLWNSVLTSLHNGEMDSSERFVMAGMAATLMTCTPAWRRASTALHDSAIASFAVSGHKVELAAGVQPTLDADVVALLEGGQIKVHTDKAYVEGKNTQNLLEAAWQIYNQDWTVLVNLTDHSFITSDNPFAIHTVGRNQERYLPLTPKLCLKVPIMELNLPPLDRAKPSIDLQKPPLGAFDFAVTDERSVFNINRLVVQNAEKLVLSHEHSPAIEAMVKEFGNYGVDTSVIEHQVPGENAFYQEFRTEVRDRRSSSSRGA